MSLDKALDILAFPMASAIVTTVGIAFTVLDAANTLKGAALSPVVFVVTTSVGAVFATIAISQINNAKEAVKTDPNGCSIKHFLLSSSSLILGIFPALMSRIISVSARFFCSSGVGGFRLGFLGAQAILQGREVYPLLKLEAEQREGY